MNRPRNVSAWALVAHGGQRESPVELSDALVDKVGDMVTGGLTAVTGSEDLPDLGEGEAGGLCLSDEDDPVDDGVGVVAVAGRGAVGLGEQSVGFVEPQRLGAHDGGGRELADQHPGLPLTFQCDGSRSVTVSSRCGREAR
jgi:hypothetical protein